VVGLGLTYCIVKSIVDTMTEDENEGH